MKETDHIDVQLGARIRARREELRMTQAQLAAAAGVTFQQIQKYERGANRISASRLWKIADTLEASVGELFGDPDKVADDPAMVGSQEVLKAWSRIPGAEQRQAVLTLLRTMKPA